MNDNKDYDEETRDLPPDHCEDCLYSTEDCGELTQWGGIYGEGKWICSDCASVRSMEE